MFMILVCILDRILITVPEQKYVISDAYPTIIVIAEKGQEICLKGIVGLKVHEYNNCCRCGKVPFEPSSIYIYRKTEENNRIMNVYEH